MVLASLQQRIANSKTWLALFTSVLYKQAREASCKLSNHAVCSVVRGPKVAQFEDGETLFTPHYLVDAKVEDPAGCSKGTFLLPSILPEASYREYAVVLDECTGIFHVARKGSVVHKDPTTIPESTRHKATSGTHFHKAVKNHDHTVEMPRDFEAIVKNDCTNMPNFMCFYKEHSSPLPYSRSVSTTESLKTLSTKAIRPGSAMLSEAVPVMRGSPKSDEQDVAFFKSLLFKHDNPEEAALARMASTRPTIASDQKFFESLLVREDQTQNEDPANAMSYESNEPSMMKPSTIAEKYALTAAWIDVNMMGLAGISGSLDLAITNLSPKPSHLLSELDLDMSTCRTHLIQEDAGIDFSSTDSLSELEQNSSKDDTVRYFQPVAPRKDEMTYEDYFPSHFPSFSETSANTEVSGGSTEVEDDSTTTSTTLTPESKDDLSLLLKKKPLGESAWLDLAQAFHHSANVSYNDNITLTETAETDQDSDVGVPVVRIPKVEEQQTCIATLPEDQGTRSVVSCSVEARPRSLEDDETFMRVQLPATPVDPPTSGIEHLTEVHNDVLKEPIEALDLATVFGGAANDWSDDDDLCTTSPGTGYESALVADYMSADPNQPHGSDALEVFELVADETSEHTSVVEFAEPSLGSVVITTSSPKQMCYRLPAAMIEAINFEFIRLRSLETPENTGVDDEKVYEQALANIKPDYNDIPDDILFWVSEVNGEFERLCSEGQRGGGAWDLNYQFQQVINLALSNVEWHYFCHTLKQSQLVDFIRPTLEAANSPKDWFMKVLVGDNDCHWNQSCDGVTSEEEEEPAASQDDTRELHHINFNGDYVYERSCTPPAVSYWAICTTRYKQLRYTDNPSKAVPAVHLKSVLSAQAFKYVDPVQHSGTNADTPTDSAGNYLTGSHLQDAVIGDVEVMYHPCGSWWEDDYSEDDVVPQQATQGDIYHQASMPEYTFLRRPYYMNMRDQQHDLVKFNGQPLVNPQLVSKLPLKHGGLSPLTQVWWMNVPMQGTSEEQDVRAGWQVEENSNRVTASLTDLVDVDRDVEAITDNDKILSTRNIVDSRVHPGYNNAETAILEAAWDAWEQFDQDSEADFSGEERISNAQDESTQDRPLLEVGLVHLDNHLGNDDRNSKGIASPVTPDLLLGLPNSMKSHKCTEEVHAPVTPALLLRLPNSGIELKDQMVESNDDESVRDAEVITDNVSEADTEIEDAETLQYHCPTEHKLGKERNIDQSNMCAMSGLDADDSATEDHTEEVLSRDEQCVRGASDPQSVDIDSRATSSRFQNGRHIDADKMMSSIIGDFCQRQMSAGDDSDIVPKLSIEASFSGSKLRPHRFFDVAAPEPPTSYMDLFTAQDLMQKEIEQSMDNLPCFSPEGGQGQWMSVAGGLMLGNYAVTRPEAAEEAAWEDVDDDDADDASSINTPEHSDHADTETLLMTPESQITKSIKPKTFDAKKVTKRNPRGLQTQLAATQNLKDKMTSALKGAEVTQADVERAVEQSMYRHSAGIASQHTESSQAPTEENAEAVIEEIEPSIQYVEVNEAAQARDLLPEQSQGTVATLSAKDKFIQTFGDRAQPTPPEPISRGSFGEIVFGVFYVSFLVAKLVLRV